MQVNLVLKSNVNLNVNDILYREMQAILLIKLYVQREMQAILEAKVDVNVDLIFNGNTHFQVNFMKNFMFF